MSPGESRHHVLTCRTSSDAGYAWGFATIGAEPQLRGQVMKECSKYVGLDVHKVSPYRAVLGWLDRVRSEPGHATIDQWQAGH